MFVLELPIPSLDSLNEIENRLIRIYRTDQGKSSLCYRYGDLCALDTILVDIAAQKKGFRSYEGLLFHSLRCLGMIIRHFEYEVTSLVKKLFFIFLFDLPEFLQRYKNKVSRRYNDFVALNEILSVKYPFRIIPQLPPKKAVNGSKEKMFFFVYDHLSSG